MLEPLRQEVYSLDEFDCIFLDYSSCYESASIGKVLLFGVTNMLRLSWNKKELCRHKMADWRRISPICIHKNFDMKLQLESPHDLLCSLTNFETKEAYLCLCLLNSSINQDGKTRGHENCNIFTK